MVTVLEALGAGAVHCGSSVGTAVEVEVDGAKITLLKLLLFEERICDCVIVICDVT